MTQTNQATSKTQAPTLESIAVGFVAALEANYGDRAELRRCHTVTEAMLTPTFYRFQRRLSGAQVRLFEPRVAALAVMLAYVREHDGSASVGSQLGRTANDRAVMSGLRFRRLVSSTEPDDLLRGWVRAIRLLNGRINAANLATTIAYWGDRVRRELAQSYYSAAPNEA